MEKTRLSSKGQIILPKGVRDAKQWEAGTQFAVEEVADGVLLRPLRPFPQTAVDEVFGCLQYKGRAKTLREMETSIAQGVKERHGRGRY
jgi:AbrB family looped-hinge helix DNA binding protein